MRIRSGSQIAGIALLAGGVYEVIKHWSAIKAWVNSFFKGISEDIFNFLMGPWNRLGDAITAKYKSLITKPSTNPRRLFGLVYIMLSRPYTARSYFPSQ